MIPNSIAFIFIETSFDDPKETERVHKEIGENNPGDWLFIKLNGDSIPSITQCLNLGIKAAIEYGCEYVAWVHGDFYFTDPNCYTTLRNILEAYPRILKICASNSRDPIEGWRIGQEQSWMMRTANFTRFDWLWFDERYLRCGGCEDYAQHLNILGHGYLIAITPDASVKHLGAQTRARYDSNPHQLYNQGIFGQTTGFGGLVEIHTKKFFGCMLPDAEFLKAMEEIDATLLSTVLPDVEVGNRYYSDLLENAMKPVVTSEVKSI